MQDWVERLLAVQEMDIRMDRLKEQIASVPGEREKVEDMLREAEAACTALHESIQDSEKELKHLEMEVDGIRAKKADFQTKSTMIKSNDEYRAALHQVAMCDEHISELEDKELEIMETIEEKRGQYRAAKARLEATKQRGEQMCADLETRLTNCRKQIDKLMAERIPALEGLDASLVKRYERLRGSPARINHPDKRALVPIRDGVCDRCRMNVTAQTRMNTRKAMVVTCEQCGTLLYHET